MTNLYNSSHCAFVAAAERKELYRFSVDLGRLALRIAERHGTNADRWYVYRYYGRKVTCETFSVAL